MKIADYHFLALLFPMALGAQTIVPFDANCCGNQPAGTPLDIREVPSAEALNARRQHARANAYQGGAGFQKVAEPVLITANKPSFLAGSEFLVGTRGFAIVPKGSTVTPGRGIRVAMEAPQGLPLLAWDAFQSNHPAVVRLLPVTDAMLAGEAKALEAFAKQLSAYQTSGIAFVTSYQGNPVSLPSSNSKLSQ